MPVLRVLLGVSLLGCSAAFAEVPSPSAKMLGLPDMSCSAWAKTKSEPDFRQPYLDWARGFLSGHNYGQPGRPVSVVSNGTISAFVDRFCADKPLSSVDVALMRMSDQYSGRNAPITR